MFHSLKSSGFIAGANIQEFEAIGKTNDVAAATKLILTGYDLYDRPAVVKYPTLALDQGLRMGGGRAGNGLPLPCGGRRSRHAHGSA